MAKPLNLIYGLSAENKILHISEVLSGKSCNCICPACNTPLIAKKGNTKVHHFAHQSTETCEYGFETSLHMAAKEILSNAKTMSLPKATFNFKGTWRQKIISDERDINIDYVELEKKTGNVIPDIIIYSGNEKFFVEIFVTHKIDKEKQEKIKELDVSTLEIDLSKERENLTIEDLQEKLLRNNKNKYWAYHSDVEAFGNALYSVAKRRRIFEYDIDYYFTRGCPLRIFKQKRDKYYYAPDHYCYDCNYCIELNEEQKYIYCTGERLITDISDFDISFENRKQKCMEWLHDKDKCYVESEICPYCGGYLRSEIKESDKFFECVNCDFTAVYNKKTNRLNVMSFSHNRKYNY